MVKIKDHSISKKEPVKSGNIRLGAKFALAGACSVLITATALFLIAIWQSGQYNKLAREEVDILISADLDHISTGIYNLVYTEDEATQIQVNSNLNVAFHVLSDSGDISLSKEQVNWSVVNQFTDASHQISLPKFLSGNRWIGKNDSFTTKTPVIDDTIKLVGETVTIFQRMNEKGDMLRIATNVETSDKKRAIGTFIPSINPDGSQNPVIETILKGNTYHGRAFVVNEWYLTAYKPLYDNTGSLIGMINAGIKQKTVEERIRHAILQTKIGKTGYVYVLGGRGKEKGHYIISHRGERDGENIWLNKDSDGHYVIQEIVNKTISLKPGEMTTVRYRWQNPGEDIPRWKIAKLIYYEPWDWVIGTSVYEDELEAYYTVLSNGRQTMGNTMGIAGLIITIIVGMVFIFITWKITRPVKDMTIVVKKITNGDLNQVIDVKSRDEIGILAKTFNIMTARLKLSMENLVKSEEKYRGIFENAIEGLFRNSLEGSIINANPAMALILGYDSPDELISKVKNVKTQLYVNPDDRKILLDKIEKYGEIFEYEVEFYKKSMEKIWVSISAKLIRPAKDSPPVVEGFLTDISMRKQAEEALAESRNYLNEILNTVADPVFVKDHEHKLVLVNNAMCDFTGWPRDKLLGMTAYDYCRKEEADIFTKIEKEVLDKGIEKINEEEFTDKNNIKHIVASKKTLYKDKNGNRFIVGIIRDITENKKAEEERLSLETRLTQSQKMEAIGTLAGGIAHDFNNILSVIIGYTELALQDIEHGINAGESLKEVLNSCERARELIKQILTFSRMHEDSYAPINIKQIIQESIRMLRPIIPSSIEIKENFQCSAYVLSNPTQINQIMLNLCSNASHSMDASGGVLGIILELVYINKYNRNYDIDLVEGRYAKLSISDTGKGMPPEIRERIFEPYFTTKEMGRGTGLGLSVIHGIIKNHNGAITCNSNKYGGTTFEVYLPAFDSDISQESLPEEVKLEKGSGKILIIDDEPVLLKMMVQVLNKLGYETVSSINSLEGLELFSQNPGDFDLVITDMTMPKMNGDILAEKIKTIRENIPVILCTGYNEHISEASSKASGIDDFLMKPVDMKTLSKVIKNILGKEKF